METQIEAKPTTKTDEQGCSPAPALLGHACKHGEVGCGQYYDCGLCAREKRAKAYKKLTEEQRAYDRYVDPLGAYHTDFPQGCSCHINPPCSFCVDGPNKD